MSNIFAGLTKERIIAVSNIGQVKRAERKLESSNITKVDDTTYKVDGETIKFDTLDKYVCTCGARTICTHVVLAYLDYLNNATEEEQQVDFSVLKEINNNTLKSLVTKKQILDAFALRDKIVFTFEETGVLTATAGEFVIRFAIPLNLKVALQKNQPVLVLIALIQYGANITPPKVTYNLEIVQTVYNTLLDIVKKGLYNLNQLDINKLNYTLALLKKHDFTKIFNNLNFITSSVDLIVNGSEEVLLEDLWQDLSNFLVRLNTILYSDDNILKHGMLNRITTKMNEDLDDVYVIGNELLERQHMRYYKFYLLTGDTIYTLMSVPQSSVATTLKGQINKLVNLKSVSFAHNQYRISSSKELKVIKNEKQPELENLAKTLEEAKQHFIKTRQRLILTKVNLPKPDVNIVLKRKEYHLENVIVHGDIDGKYKGEYYLLEFEMGMAGIETKVIMEV